MANDVTKKQQEQMPSYFMTGLSKLNLNDSCFIMIAPFDIFGKNLYRYTFEGACRECPELSLGDGAVRIFINTKGGNREEFSQEFLDFMDYINTSTDEVADRTDSAKIKMIHEKVKRIKVSEKMGVKYMQKWEEIAYAREEGRSEEIVKCVESAMENFHVDLQRACEGLGTTIEEYSKAKASMELQGI